MFIVYDEFMNIKPFPQGVTPLDVFISSINSKRIKDEIEGSHGFVDKGRTHETRNIEIDMLLKAKDTRDYRLIRDAVFSFFNENDYFYISESYQKGKRYKVAAVESFIPERFSRTVSTARFNLEMVDLPFAESTGTTQDIQRDGIDNDLWAEGMGLIPDNESFIYTHTTNTFRIYNAGNVPIHPFMQDLKITISNVVGSSSNLELKNETNGTLFRVNEGVSSSQTIMLDGANITSNGLQFSRKTNKGFVELDPGWNVFKITGATSAKVQFDFRFYYL